MQLSNIFSLFVEYATLAILFLGILCAIFLFSYYIIYKYLLKGKKQLSWKKLVLTLFLLGYAIVVVGATVLFRGFGLFLNTPPNFILFSTYLSAWSSGNISEWRNIIMNMIMFIPFGIMLPLTFDKLRTLWKTAVICLLLSFSIEMAQLITGAGIFALDDIFNNTLGGIIGFGLFFLANKIGKKISTME